MIRLHLAVEPETFMGGMILRFTVRHGTVTTTVQRHVPMQEFLCTTILDLAVDDLKQRLVEALQEHKRQCASVEPMRC